MMGSKNFDKDTMDALSEMKSSIASDNAEQQSNTCDTSAPGTLHESQSADVQSHQSLHKGMPSGRTINIFHEIDNLMAQFFQSLKVIDSQFGEYAQIFYNEANRLADTPRTEEEDRELIANIALGLTTTAIGKLWQSISVSKQLGEIKRILKNEAEVKIQTVASLKRRMPDILKVAEARFREVPYKYAYLPMQNLRNSLYHASMLEFLMATYEAALKDHFQDEVIFPTYARVNRYLLYACLRNNPSLVENENIAARQNEIDLLIVDADSAIRGKEYPQKDSYLFVKDPGIMAIAICDYYPLEDAVKWSNEDDMIMASESVFAKFMGLYDSALNCPDTDISDAVLNNETLVDMNRHFFKIAKTREEYEGNILAKLSIILLFALLGFLTSFVIWDIRWYWSIVVALLTGLIVKGFMSFGMLADNTIEKLINISKTIQMNSYEKAGFQQIVNLAELEKKNSNVWVAALLGGLIGLVGGPIGCIIGIIIGILIASSKSGDEESDYSYDHIRVKTSKMSKFLLVILMLANLYIFADWLFGW